MLARTFGREVRKRLRARKRMLQSFQIPDTPPFELGAGDYQHAIEGTIEAFEKAGKSIKTYQVLFRNIVNH